MIKLTPIRRALKMRETLQANHYTEKRWNTNLLTGQKIEQNNKQLCKDLNEFYRDVYGDDCRFCMIKGKLHLISSTNATEIDDKAAQKLIQDMRQGNKDGHFSTLI